MADSFAAVNHDVFRTCAVLATNHRVTTVDVARRIVDDGGGTAIGLQTCQRGVVFVEGVALSLLEAWRHATDGSLLLGEDAVRFVFELACGLHSRVLGETEILGQVRTALLSARESKTQLGPIDRWLQSAVAAGKRARSETSIGLGAASLASVVGDVVLTTAHGPQRILVIGAGSLGSRIAEILRSRDPHLELVITNRTQSRAVLLAERVAATAVEWSQPINCQDCDTIIVAVDGQDVQLSHVNQRRSVHIIDVGAVPQEHVRTTVESRALRYTTLTDCEAVMNRTIQRRQLAIDDVQNIIHDEVDVLRRWWKVRHALQRIDDLQREVDVLCGGLDVDTQETVARLRRNVIRSIGRHQV